MKTLSYRIENGQVIVTGDSVKGTIVNEDKQFLIGDPSVVDMDTPDAIKRFFGLLLQGNHDYSFPADNNIMIDGIYYIIYRYTIESLLSKRIHYFPKNEPRNFFKLYQEFIQFQHEQQQLINLEDKLNTLLEKFEIDKAVSGLVRTDEGIYIRVAKYSYDEQNYPNFELLLRKDGTLKFLHFYEREGEYYSNGDTPLGRKDILEELGRQKRLLDKYDKLFALFNNIII